MGIHQAFAWADSPTPGGGGGVLSRAGCLGARGGGRKCLGGPCRGHGSELGLVLRAFGLGVKIAVVFARGRACLEVARVGISVVYLRIRCGLFTRAFAVIQCVFKKNAFDSYSFEIAAFTTTAFDMYPCIHIYCDAFSA